MKIQYATSMLALCDGTDVSRTWLRDDKDAAKQFARLIRSKEPILKALMMQMVALLSKSAENARYVCMYM